MLLGLRTWWLPAIGTPFLTLHVELAKPGNRIRQRASVGGGGDLAGRAADRPHRPAAAAGGDDEYTVLSTQYSVFSANGLAAGHKLRNLHFSFFNSHFAIVSVVLAPSGLPSAAAAARWSRLQQDAKVGAFFARGILDAGNALALVYRQLRRGATGPAVARGRGNLLRMALRNAARNPGRSALAIGLTAAACFLIAAVSVFRVDPAQTDTRQAQRQRRLRADRPERRADLLRSQHARRPQGTWRQPRRRGAAGRMSFLCLSRQAGRRRKLLEPLPGPAAANAGRGHRTSSPATASLGPIRHRDWATRGKCSAIRHRLAARNLNAIARRLDQTMASYSLNPPKGRGEAYTCHRRP